MNRISLALAVILAGLAGCATAGDDPVDAAGSVIDAGKSDPDADPSVPDAAPRPDARLVADAMPPADANPAAPDANPSTPDAGPPGDPCTEAALRPDNDTCGATIDLTAGASSAGGITTYGDTTGYGDTAYPPSSCTNGYGLDGPDAIYRVTASAGQTITASVTTDGYDAGIYILTNCSDATTCVVGDDSVVGSGTETITYTVPNPATYYIVVDSYISTEYGCFTLNVRLQ